MLDGREWKYYWPVRVQGVCKRGFAFGLYFTVILGIPYACLLAIVLHWNATPISGKGYCWLKGAYCGFASLVMFPGMFFSAISTDKFAGPEYAYLMGASSPAEPSYTDAKDSPPSPMTSYP